MFIPDPGSWFLPRIPDLGSRIQKQQQKRGVEKNFCHTFLCSHKFHKIEHYFSFEVLKKKIWVNFQRIIELFTQKIVTKLSKIWVRDPGSGKNLFRIPDSGSRGKKGTGSRIRIRNTGHRNAVLQVPYLTAPGQRETMATLLPFSSSAQSAAMRSQAAFPTPYATLNRYLRPPIEDTFTMRPWQRKYNV